MIKNSLKQYSAIIKSKHALLLGLAFIVICPAFAEAEYNLEAPDFYIDKDACPFECCAYGDWTINAKTPGYEKPDMNSKIIGYFQEGNIAHVPRGEAHVYSGKFEVKEVTQKNRRLSGSVVGTERTYSEEVKAGDIFHIYTYMGEGYYKIWYKGDFYEDSIYASGIAGEIIKQPESTWWVYAESPLGWTGWTKETGNFGNNSGCPDAYFWNVRVIYNSEKERLRSTQEMTNYKNLLKQLSAIDDVKIMGNGYAVAYNQLNSMYIDLYVINIHLMGVEQRVKAVKKVAHAAHGFAEEIGIKDRVKIEAMCNYCEEIKLQY